MVEAHLGEHYGFTSIESTLITDASVLVETLVTWPTLLSKDLYDYLRVEKLGFTRLEYSTTIVRKLVKADYGQLVRVGSKLKSFVIINVEMVIIVLNVCLFVVFMI